MVEREDFEVHLATCSECAGELAHYREVMAAVGSLRDTLENPSEGFPERVIAHVLQPQVRLRASLRRAAQDRRVRAAVVSLGGALVGAGAVALLWRRAARRGVPGTGVAA